MAPTTKLQQPLHVGALDVYPTVSSVVSWLDEYKATYPCQVDRIPFSASTQWTWDHARSNLAHRSGHFFSVRGFASRLAQRPMIHQPEIGTQGLIVYRSKDDIFVLMQARTEPGNLNLVELGPTIQATYSNYSRIHQGRATAFLDLFHSTTGLERRTLADVVLPELGTFFFQKYNRNIILEMASPAGLTSDRFKWVPLSTLCELLNQAHIVNNDARLLIGLLIVVLFSPTNPMSPDQPPPDAWRTILREKQRAWAAEVANVPIPELPGWLVTEDEIRRVDRTGFSFIQLKVQAADREVEKWDQPMIDTGQPGFVGLQVRQRGKGQWEVLTNYKEELGNELGHLLCPTVVLDNAADLELNPHASVWNLSNNYLINVLCAEEGGRFFHSLNRYVVAESPNGHDTTRPGENAWIALEALMEAYAEPHVFSDDCRGIVSLFLSHLLATGALTMRPEPLHLIHEPSCDCNEAVDHVT